MYVDVALTTENHVRIHRRFHAASHENLLWQVHRAHTSAEEVFGARVTCIDVCECSREKFDKICARDVYFANICGKVIHCSAVCVIRAAMQPMVCKVANAFGRFSGLFGPHCNLLTSSTNSVTLFRAARHSRDVMVAIEHALNPETIATVTLHMLVATARIAHPICLQCVFVDRIFLTDSRWTAFTVVKTEEGAHMKSIALSHFDPEWIKSVGRDLQVPSKILLNITKNGAVNMFMSVQEMFSKDIEYKYVPLYDILVAIISKYT